VYLMCLLLFDGAMVVWRWEPQWVRRRRTGLLGVGRRAVSRSLHHEANARWRRVPSAPTGAPPPRSVP